MHSPSRHSGGCVTSPMRSPSRHSGGGGASAVVQRMQPLFLLHSQHSLLRFLSQKSRKSGRTTRTPAIAGRVGDATVQLFSRVQPRLALLVHCLAIALATLIAARAVSLAAVAAPCTAGAAYLPRSGSQVHPQVHRLAPPASWRRLPAGATALCAGAACSHRARAPPALDSPQWRSLRMARLLSPDRHLWWLSRGTSWLGAPLCSCFGGCSRSACCTRSVPADFARVPCAA